MGHLQQQLQAAAFLVAAECADGHEWEKQGDRNVERAESRHQHAIKWGQAARQLGEPLCRRAAGFGVERDRLGEAVAHHGAEQQRHHPKRPARGKVAELPPEQWPQRGARAGQDFRRAQGRLPPAHLPTVRGGAQFRQRTLAANPPGGEQDEPVADALGVGELVDGQEPAAAPPPPAGAGP